MTLTIAEVKNAKAGDKNFKLADSGGLFLLVTKSGAKSWRYKYRFGVKEKLLTLGLYSAARASLRVVEDRGRPPGTERRSLFGLGGCRPAESGSAAKRSSWARSLTPLLQRRSIHG